MHMNSARVHFSIKRYILSLNGPQPLNRQLSMMLLINLRQMTNALQEY